MAKYRFDEIAVNCTEKRMPDEEDRLNYIGLEHLDTGCLHVNRWGSKVPLKGEKLIMHKGDVLLGKRNAYLRRAAICPHDGIFSAHGMVLQPRENVIDKSFFPLFISSDYFFDEVIRISVGSLSPTVNWKDLRELEFEIPDMKVQKQLARVLWAINDTIESYKNLITTTDQLVKSQFIEMFGDFKTNNMNWPIVEFNNFATIDANMVTDYDKYANYPHIGIDSIEKETGRLQGYRTVKEDNVISGKYLFTPDHIIYSKIRPNLNKVALPDFDGLCSADAYPILPNKNNCNRVFLAMVLRSKFFLDYILEFSTRTNMPKVNRKQIAGFKMPLPPLELQNRFAFFVQESDKSKFELEQALKELTATYKRIIDENLS